MKKVFYKTKEAASFDVKVKTISAGIFTVEGDDTSIENFTNHFDLEYEKELEKQF